MERTILTTEAVASELNEHFVESRLHTDKTKPAELAKEHSLLRDELAKSVAAPIYLVYDPVTETVLAEVQGYRPEGTFLKFLQEARTKRS